MNKKTKPKNQKPETGNQINTFTIRLPRPAALNFKIICSHLGLTMNSKITELVETYVDEMKKGNPELPLIGSEVPEVRDHE